MAGKQLWKVDHQYLIRAPPERVFRAFTDPKVLVTWLCDTAKLEARPGGPFSLGWTNGPTHTGQVLEHVPGRRLVLEWSWPGVALTGTRLAMAVEPTEGGSLFRISHEGFPRLAKWGELYAGAEWGWTYFAMNLKSVLEAGRDLRSPRDGWLSGR